MMEIKKLFKIGIINTLRMNFHYFGWGGVIHPQILASRNVKIFKLGGTVIKPRKSGFIQIGLNEIKVFDKKYERCLWDNSGEIIVNGSITIGQGVRISNSGHLEFGDNVCIQANTTIICNREIKIGSATLISWDNLIMDTDFHKIYSRVGQENSGYREQINPPKEIIIGAHTWIGCRCLILKGSIIPPNSIVAAGSTITKDFAEEHTVIGSNKILKTNVEWEG